MKKFNLPIKTDDLSTQRLTCLQERFSEACNFVAHCAAQHQCYSRVTLHHLCYRTLRSEFGDLGSQLASNAIYAVCRAAKAGGRPQGVLKFSKSAPVFFDRHTLSIKAGKLSMVTLQGRMKFEFPVDEELGRLFQGTSIKEVTLEGCNEGYQLSFYFKSASEPDATTQAREGASS